MDVDVSSRILLTIILMEYRIANRSENFHG
jgi:hypothetical protein